MSPDVPAWGALLGACWKHGEYEVGERVGRKLVNRDPLHDGFQTMLSNIYAKEGMWQSVDDLRGSMKQRHVQKVSGHSVVKSSHSYEILAGDGTWKHNADTYNIHLASATKLFIFWTFTRGKRVAVASFEGKKWDGEIKDLQTNIYITSMERAHLWTVSEWLKIVTGHHGEAKL